MKDWTIKIGDIFEDLDRRHPGRRIRVLEINGTQADGWAWMVNVVGGRRTRVSLKRLNSNDYRKVKVAEPRQYDPDPASH